MWLIIIHHEVFDHDIVKVVPFDAVDLGDQDREGQDTGVADILGEVHAEFAECLQFLEEALAFDVHVERQFSDQR